MPRTAKPKKRSTPSETAVASPPIASSKPAAPIAGGAEVGVVGGGPSLRQLAHELNSLLDGSMRCVGMARTTLQQHAPSESEASVIDSGLSRAHAAMRHMAALLERAMKPNANAAPAGPAMMFDSKQSLQELLDELAGLLQPHAMTAGAKLIFEVTADCARLTAGALGPVLMNGVRNALQACESLPANGSATDGTVNVMCACEASNLNIAIAGPTAVKPAGHRIGLALSEQIVRELGGEMALLADGDRTTLRVCVPIANLSSHA